MSRSLKSKWVTTAAPSPRQDGGGQLKKARNEAETLILLDSKGIDSPLFVIFESIRLPVETQKVGCGQQFSLQNLAWKIVIKC